MGHKRKLGCLPIGLFLLFCLPAADMLLIQYRQSKAIDGWSCEWTAELIIDFMDHHGGKWPTGWDDLRPSFGRVRNHVSSASLESLSKRVTVDWKVDPGQLRQATQPSSTIIVPKKPEYRTNWEQDPNMMIYEYLHRPVTQPDSAPASQD